MSEAGNDRIVRVAARGDGVTAEGHHVPGAAPGDRLDPEGGLIWGPHHATPPCPHFDLCGGCTLQHLDEAALAEFVRDRVVGALAGKGLEAETVHPVHLSPAHSRRRATVHFSHRKKQLQLGFHTAASHRLVDVRTCPVLDPRLFDVMTALRRLLERWPGGDFHGSAELTLADQGVDVMIAGLTLAGLQTHDLLLHFARDMGLARLAVDQGDGPETQWEPEPATITLGGMAVGLPFGAFLQPSLDGEAALVAAAREALGEAAMVADLFAGLGTFALNLIQPGRKVYAAEAARDPIMALKLAANRAQLPVFTEHRDLFRNPLRPDMLDRFDAVLLDPPRAGAREQVDQLAASKVPLICYVSCNPATFARDARTLADAGFRIGDLWPVGQFRWSTHVELVARFVRVRS